MLGLQWAVLGNGGYTGAVLGEWGSYWGCNGVTLGEWGSHWGCTGVWWGNRGHTGGMGSHWGNGGYTGLGLAVLGTMREQHWENWDMMDPASGGDVAVLGRALGCAGHWDMLGTASTGSECWAVGAHVPHRD